MTWPSTGTGTTKDTPVNDPAPVSVVKIDAQTGEEITEGSVPSFAGANYDYEYFTDYFNTVNPETYKQEHQATYQRHWVMETNEKGITGVDERFKNFKVSGDEFYKDQNGSIICPLGTYVVHETKAPEGYLVSDKYYIIQVVQDTTKSWGASTVIYDALDIDPAKQPLPKIVDPATGTEKTQLAEQVQKGDYKFLKVGPGQKLMSGIPFKITSKTTGEWHIAVTNVNGELNTSNDNVLHSHNTNANDAAYDQSTGKIDESKLTMDAGTWFALDKKTGKVADPNDEVRALPFDTYTVEELEISKNTAYYPFISREFTIFKNDIIVDGGTWINTPPTCESEASASDGTQVLDQSESIQAKDRVYYTGLLEGETYDSKA